MNDFEALAKMARSEYGHQPGLIAVSVEGEPPVGIRYSFSSAELAARFVRLRQLHNSVEPLFANTFRRDGGDIVEVWECLTGYRGSLR